MADPRHGAGGDQKMLARLWWGVRVAAEILRQYRAAVVTTEALVWHHGYKGLDAALVAAETRTGDLQEDVRANLVARFAADRYMQFKRADVFGRARLLESWSRRKGQVIGELDHTAPAAQT
jgi:hypothetical protein